MTSTIEFSPTDRSNRTIIEQVCENKNHAKTQFDPIPDAIAALKAGQAVIVVDDEDRENEGDLICAAEFATPELINFMAVEARSLICLAMTGDRLDRLDLPLMVEQNSDRLKTAFTVSIDAATHFGVTTGISAKDRSRTIQVAIAPETKPKDLRWLACQICLSMLANINLKLLVLPI